MLTGPRRYSDLQEGLAGIATNLLTDRLRHLEQHGVVDRDSRGTYKLTKWGQGLAEPIYALARWGGPLMAEPAGDDQFRSSWLVPVVAGIFGGDDPSRPEVTIEIHTGDNPMTIVSTRVAFMFNRDPPTATTSSSRDHRREYRTPRRRARQGRCIRTRSGGPRRHPTPCPPQRNQPNTYQFVIQPYRQNALSDLGPGRLT